MGACRLTDQGAAGRTQAGISGSAPGLPHPYACRRDRDGDLALGAAFAS